MLTLTSLSLQLIIAVTAGDQTNCSLLAPPATAGETQIHGVILYIYPRSHTIDETYSGCQNQWFLDNGDFRKLSVIHYENGVITMYDNINLNGKLAYRCQYKNNILKDNTHNRCPDFSQLKKKTYHSGCYNKSKLNRSGSYEVTSSDCTLK